MSKQQKQVKPEAANAVKTDKFTKALSRFMYYDENKSFGQVVFGVAMIIAAIACLCTVIYWICGPMEGYLHGDYTDTIYWANASYVSGEVFSPDFKYAALLPFSANLWFIPLVAMFGVSMRAQVIGMVIFALLTVAAIYFMCRSFKWSIPWTMFTVSAFLMIMSSSEKLLEIMWGHVIYYSLALLLLFVGLGIVQRLSELRLGLNVKSFILPLIALVFFTFSATNDFQMISLTILPVLGAFFAERFFDSECKLLDRRNTQTGGILLGMLLSTAVGLKILEGWKGEITANYANAQSKIAPIANWKDNLFEFPEKYFALMGFDGAKSMPMVEKETILMFVNVLIGVLILVMPLVLLFGYKHIQDRGTKIILWAHLVVSFVTMFGWVCGYLSSANWRLTTMVGTGIIASVAAIRFLATRRAEKGFSQAPRVAAAICACFALLTVLNYKTINDMPKDHGRDNILHRLTEKLEDEGLEYGYATFWRSQPITLLSDSRVQTCMILADEKNGVWSDFYQNSYSWYRGREDVDRYFVLLSGAENTNAGKNADWAAFLAENEHELIEFEGYYIYVFNRNINITLPEGK